MLTDHVDFELVEGRSAAGGTQSPGGELERSGGDGRRPLAGVVALACPGKAAMELAVALYEGMMPLAEQYDLAIAGGDTNSWDGPLAVSITLLGGVTDRGPLRAAAPGPATESS